MATGYDQDELTQKIQDISLNSGMGGCAGKSDDRMEKDKWLKENPKFLSHTAKVLRIRNGISLDYVKEKKQEVEKNTSCSISVAKKEDEEPSYHKSWTCNSRSIVIAEGNVENSVTDIIVCPIDEHCQPAGESAEHIFQKGGWTELENAAKCSKREHEKDHGTGDTNWLYSTSTTGSLNCRRIWFVYIKKLRDSMELLSKTLYDEVEKNYWRSIYFPVESYQIKDGTIQKMAETFLKPSALKALTGMEIVLCVSSGSRDCEQLDAICQEFLKGNRVISFYNETRSNVDEYIPCSCFPSPFEVKIEIESILDIAKKGEVDVIVNSTNQKLILKEGYVSSLILKEGGPEIQTECDDHDFINDGDIMVSSAGKLRCKKIIHCVLINWISTGNLSLKVLSSLVKKCLEEVEKCNLKTIAFPALGTGKLEYPYIHVARTMQKAVYEYGISTPKTCIKKVVFALYKGDRECIKTFKDVHDSDQVVKDFILNPTIQFLENRISKSGLLIQLMPQEINEPVDAVIEFISSHSSSRHGQREEGASGPVDLTWCKEKGCYTGTYKLGQEMKLVIEQCFTMLESMKITSTRIDIRNIDASKGFETVMNAFCDNITSASSRITKSNKFRYLRKLQILACWEEIEKVKKSQQRKSAEAESSFFMMKWITNLLKSGECDEKWKEVAKTQTKHMICCIRGETKDNVENAWEQLRRKVGGDIQGVGRWCFCQDNYKWKFVSKICNIKLIEAEEKYFNMVDITDDDGIMHTYNLEDYGRTQKNPTGDVRKEKIRFIHGCETLSPSPSKSAMWAAFHKDKWISLPMQCCQLLNSAAQSMSNVKDNQNYVYDLKNKTRTLQINGSNSTREEILCIEAAADQTKHFTDVKMENGHKADFSVFEIVTGMIMYPEEYGNDVQNIIKDSGCFVKNIDNHSSVQISGTLEGIEKVNLQLQKKKREVVNRRNSNEGTDYGFVIAISMSEKEYKAVSYFGGKCTWFKKISDIVKYENGSLFVNELDVGDGQDFEKKLKDLLENVQRMTSDSIQIPEEFKKDNVEKTIEEIERIKPSVYLLWKENNIEFMSDNYTEFLEAKGLLQQKMFGKGNRRAGRTFTKEEGKQNSSPEKTTQDTNLNEMSVSKNHSMRSRKVELKTKEGLIIQIYAGSITRLDVDCIVNAANENLWHGGGVAAAISEAAGYEFDQESRDYVQKYGPIPVGRCCVTSAGKLPYKCVIHTVGPKWGDYRDKSQCLKLLQDSVKVTFKEADYQKMRSIAIPAISSGIFSVPRDKCVEQYFEATMSFSRSYPFKYLQEIHFVDRDESMVRAIQETFQSRSKSASTSEKTDKKNDTFAFNGEEKTVRSNMPLSISFTTVNVSKNLQIKVHIGNITDMAADALVCPQDKDCLSENDIARDIFGKISDKQPSFNSMKYGDVCSQKLQENSKWKMIIHAVPPVYDAEYAKNHSNFVRTLNTIIQEIIKTADEAKLHSIAIPLLGTGTEEYRTPLEACASSFFKAVMANMSELMYLNDIYLVLKEEEQEKMYLENFALINCKITQRPVTNNGKSDDFGKTMKEMPKEGENCCICMDTPTKPKQLRKCGHIFCKECIEQYFEYKPACPSCGTIYGKVTGDQPPGTMSIRTNGLRLQGFNDSSGTIILTYFFNDGKQGEEHPDPGKVYKGFSRSGYLPFNKKGRLIAKLLNVAFSRRLVFTIGRSRTTGHDGVITWNDIHHKTRMEGGPARFGYPDPTYLDRVLEELEAKGVTEESADDPEEYKEYSKEIGY